MNSTFRYKRTYRAVVVLAAAIMTLAVAMPASADSSISIAKQYGVSYLPLLVMGHNNLVKKAAEENGLEDVEVTWATFPSGAAMTAALLSGSLDFTAAGVGPTLKIWDKTQDLPASVHAIAALNTMPLLLNCNDPTIQTIADLGKGDRIALPAVKVSIQAITLQMAVAKKFGIKQYAKLDPLTVSMAHPDGMAALIAGGTGINCHLTSPPYQYQELKASDKIHTVLNSYDVLGGPATFNTVWARGNYREANPKAYDAVLSALAQAIKFIKNNKHKAAQIYVEETNSSQPVSFIYDVITKPGVSFTLFPKRVMEYAKFMYKTGSIDDMPKSVKSVFFPDVYNKYGKRMK